jgi:hypothetical protein
MTAQSRNAGYRTAVSNTTFTYTSPFARMREGRNTVYNISQPRNSQGTQDDGTMATKHVSKILNGTLKAYGWITFTKSVGTQYPSPPSLKVDLEMGSSYLHFFRVGNKTYCNGFPIKSYMTGPIFLGCFSKLATWNQDRVDKFIYDSMDSVPEVLAAMTNNLKFNYMLKGRWETSLLKVSLISRKEVAVQLYEGCWMPMKQTAFRSLFNAGAGRNNKYSTISPEELYFNCTGEHLTDVQIKYMYAYLDQNTSTKLVTKRSLELLDGLPEMFPTRVKKFDFQDHVRYNTVLLVKGNQLDWAVSGHVHYEKVSTGRQNVTSQAIIDIRNYDLQVTIPSDDGIGSINNYQIKSWSNMMLHCVAMKNNPNWRFDLVPKQNFYGMSNINLRRSNGSVFHCKESGQAFVALSGICIDQSNVDVSIGDQFASRVMAFLNDTASFGRVSTMRSYEKIKPAFRVDLDDLSELQIPTFD